MQDIQPIILAAVARAPLWARQDLTSSDGVIRERAEDALAAIIVQALREAEASGG